MTTVPNPEITERRETILIFLGVGGSHIYRKSDNPIRIVCMRFWGGDDDNDDTMLSGSEKALFFFSLLGMIHRNVERIISVFRSSGLTMCHTTENLKRDFPENSPPIRKQLSS